MKSADQILIEFIDHGTLPKDAGLRGMLHDVGRPGTRVEHNQLDLKQEFTGTDVAWLDLIRDTVAMSNSGGGVLIFGISNDGNRVGIRHSLSDSLDATRIANRLQRYTSAAQAFRVAYCEALSYRKRFGFLWIYPGVRLIIFDKSIQYSSSNKVALQQAVLYVRRKSATEQATQHELNEAVDRIATRNLKAFIARIDHVASLPASTQLVATAPGTTRGYYLTASGEGIPVQIVGPEHGAPAMKIDETLLPDVPLATPTHEIANQVRQWHADPNHRVQPGTLHRWFLSREDLDLDAIPDSATFALLSAIDRNDFPMFWASKVDRKSLREILEAKIASNSYPANQIVPYLVGAFFWDERSSILPIGYGNKGASKRVIDFDELRRFVISARQAASIIRFDNKEMRIGQVLRDRDTAMRVYESILAAGEDTIQRNRITLHQIDLFLHVPVDDPDGS